MSGRCYPAGGVRSDRRRAPLTDVEKCYVYSRLRPQYCHICVDVCPFVHKANGDTLKKERFKRYTAKRKKAGYKTPAWFPEEEPAILKV